MTTQRYEPGMTVVCSACNERFESNFDFNQHNCSMTPEPREGESWDDYKARCEAFRNSQEKN